MPQRTLHAVNMVDRIAHAIAEADGGDFQVDPARYRRLALAALQPLASPTKAMIDAAHQAASFDDAWAINNRSDFKRAVKAMLAASAVKRGMIKTGRRSGVDDSATISTHCVTGTNGRSLQPMGHWRDIYR